MALFLFRFFKSQLAPEFTENRVFFKTNIMQ